MLLGFSLTNFRSFLGKQEFSYCSSADRTHAAANCVPTGLKSVPRLSKSAVVFGANGSGKSNLINGLAIFRHLVLHSTDLSQTEFARLHTPFQFGPSAEEPTCFAIDVLRNKIRYRYSLAYNSEGIVAERLLVNQTGKSQRWFERFFDNASRQEHWLPFSPMFSGPREVWRRATHRNALFLTTAAKLECALVRPLAQWFETGLDILPATAAPDVRRATALVQDYRTKQRVLEVLKSVGSDVSDVRTVNPDVAAGAQLQGRPLLEFLYRRNGCPPMWIEASRESAGIVKLLAKLGPLLHAIEGGKLLVVDEFDQGLHPLIGRFLLRLINDPQASASGAQMLVTSHNTALMDLNFLRRDEIWLMKLDSPHSSNLSRILESSPRRSELVAKGYLRGR